MPPDGYDTVTVPESTKATLEDLAGDDESIASVIERLADGVESDDGTLTTDEFEAQMRDFVEDIASTTSRRTADELESRLR